MTRRLAAAAALAAFVCAGATSTWAADVVVEQSIICASDPSSPLCHTRVYFRAAPGERNRVVALQEGAEMVVHESGAPFAAGPDCRSATPTEVRCALPHDGRGQMLVYAQDGDDTVEMRALGVAFGGPGADLLTNTGRLGDIRLLFGGAGHDRLVGGADPETLDGDAGDDLIRGAGGDDRIYGDGGSDGLYGGAGNDRLRARGGGRDRVDCGPGRRDEAQVDRNDRVTGCERIRR